MVSGKGIIPAGALLLLLCAATAGAEGLEGPLAPFFAQTADRGEPVAAAVRKDGTGYVDAFSEGEVIRHSFDKEGRVKRGPSPAPYPRKVLAEMRASAADAARDAGARAAARQAAVRHIKLEAEGGKGVYLAAVYDANGLFLGWHRYLSSDGAWDGWTDAMGEEDPLAK